MRAKKQHQTSMEDQVLDNPTLLAAMDKWYEDKATVKTAQENADQSKLEVDFIVKDLNVKPGEEYRVGPYIIKGTHRDEVERNFTVPAKDGVSYTVVGK